MEPTTRWGSLHASVRQYLGNILDVDLHSKRIDSLADATLGVMAGASLAVSMIGLALAQARGLLTKHAVKQVDRLFSNGGIDVWRIFSLWVPEIIGAKKSIMVVMDWTNHDADKQATLTLSMVTDHGRATPLLWHTVKMDDLKDRRSHFEDTCLIRLREVVPEDVKVTILADRGFDDTKLFAFLPTLNLDYVIRIRKDIYIESMGGEVRHAATWVGHAGRAKKLRNVLVTAKKVPIPAFVCVHAKGMKDSWCLVTTHSNATARQIIGFYAKRWSIEPGFRDTKDIHFGMGMSKTHIKSPERRDRLLLVSAFAIVMLTLLGVAGESLGMDRHLKVNTTKRRTHSLFRQGWMLYELIPTMSDALLVPLIERFDELLWQHPVFSEIFGKI